MTAPGALPRRALRPDASWWIWVPVWLTALLLAVIPFYLAVRAIEGGTAAWEYLRSPAPWWLLVRSIGLASVVAAGSALIALPFAWLTARTDLPGRRIWMALLCLPLVIPSYVAALVWIGAAGSGGLFRPWLQQLGVPSDAIYGFSGAAMLLVLISYPYAFLPVHAAFRRMNRSYEEAARTLGRNPWRAFWEIAFPLLRPPLLSGVLVVALYVLSDFGAVMLLRCETFTSAIYLQYRTSFDRSSAAVLSLLLIAVTAGFLIGERRVRGPGDDLETRRSSGIDLHPVRLGLWRWPAFLGCTLFVAATLGVPILVLMEWAGRGAGIWVLALKSAGAAWNSCVASGLAATAGVLVALPLAWVSVRRRSRRAALVERLTFGALALPGVVVALALVFAVTRAAPWLYQTLGLLVLAYVLRFLPQAVGALRAALIQTPRGLEESARSLGRGPLTAFCQVTAPLLAPGMMAGWVLMFLTAMKELPATLILGPTGFPTLATEIWSYANEAMMPEAAAISLLLLAVAALPMVGFIVQRSR